MTETRVDVALDLKGLRCPTPVVKLSQAIKEVPVGGVVEGTATDLAVLADIPAWARSTGNELLSIAQEGQMVTFRVRRAS
jgi:tRNA 2-thiouridine synthesizing protein A